MKQLFTICALSLLLILGAQERLISATQVPVGPKVDGDLSDPVWESAECQSDFREASGGIPLENHKTELRILHDGKYLYFGVRMEFASLPEGPVQPWSGNLERKDYKNHHYSAEFFLDPGRSTANYYQYLINSENQATGHLNMNWDMVEPSVKIAGKRNGNVWTLEFAFPGQNKLQNGKLWGFDLVMNDIRFYSMWHPIAGAFNNPQAFGILMIGSYRQWFDAAIAEKRTALNTFSTVFAKDKQLLAVTEDCRKQLDAIEKKAAGKNDPQQLFAEFMKTEKIMKRLEDKVLYLSLVSEKQ